MFFFHVNNYIQSLPSIEAAIQQTKNCFYMFWFQLTKFVLNESAVLICAKRDGQDKLNETNRVLDQN